MLSATMELPAALVFVGGAYIALTGLAGAALLLFCSPLLIINRRPSAYWDDWNVSQRAPWLFWHIGAAWLRLSELLPNSVLPAPQRVADMASGFMKSQVLLSVNELGVPGALESGPKTAAQLAQQLRVHQDYLERLLRAADRLKLVATTHPTGPGGPALYHLTQLSAVLCESHPNAVNSMVSMFGDHYAPFGFLAEGVQRGATPYKLYAKGKSHWEHMRAQPELYERFNKAMTNFNNLCPIEAVFSEYSLAPFSRVVDVGGGLGAFSAASLAVSPGIKAHLFDLPHVVKQAQQAWKDERAELLPRISFTGGSFFDSGKLPAAVSDTDLFVLRQILHDWSDGDCLKILKQVRAAIGTYTGCRLVLIESCIASKLMTLSHTPRITGDIHMLVQYGDAKERTETEFEQLLAGSGFELTRILPTKSMFFVLEARPV